MKTHAFPIQLAKEALLLGRYPEALGLLKPLSETDLEAQFLHAYLYFWDDTLSRQQALVKLQNLAEQNHAEALYLLAACPDLIPPYQFRLPQTEQAHAYLLKAAELGSDAARTDLAQCYLEGVGVEKNVEKAYTLLIAAFEESKKRFVFYPKMCLLLSEMRLKGWGCRRNLNQRMRFLAYSTNASDYFTEADLAKARTLFPRKRLSDSKDTSEWYIQGFDKIEEDLQKKNQNHWQSFLHYYCCKSLVYDLRDASFDAYCDFIFDHFPLLHRDREVFRWDKQAKVIFKSSQLVHFYTQLFTDPAFLHKRYSEDQIKQALGYNGIRGSKSWTIGCAMFSEDVTTDETEACIRSTYGLFGGLFNHAGYTEIGFMWWDIGYGGCERPRKYDPNYKPPSKEDLQRLNQAEFETIVRVLNSKSSYEAQHAAIHGLGHRSHPDKIKTLEQYLEDHPNIPAWLREYALYAIEVPLVM